MSFNERVQQLATVPELNGNSPQFNNMASQLTNVAKMTGLDKKVNVPKMVGQMSSLPGNIQNLPGSINVPEQQSGPMNIQGYSPDMEDKAWDLESDLTSRKELSSLKMGMYDSFCKCNQSDPATLNVQCKRLTEYNCKRVGCCVFTSDNKCLGGTSSGPNFESPSIDYYYYKNKCYGTNCPTKKCNKS